MFRPITFVFLSWWWVKIFGSWRVAGGLPLYMGYNSVARKRHLFWFLREVVTIEEISLLEHEKEDAEKLLSQHHLCFTPFLIWGVGPMMNLKYLAVLCGNMRSFLGTFGDIRSSVTRWKDLAYTDQVKAFCQIIEGNVRGLPLFCAHFSFNSRCSFWMVLVPLPAFTHL